jgi:archaeosine-15-forming tRNA-guanine transglycosylase
MLERHAQFNLSGGLKMPSIKDIKLTNEIYPPEEAFMVDEEDELMKAGAMNRENELV